MTLDATFVRHRQRRDRIYVRRQDGTSTFWDFPSYGDGLPHDLVHLVVEDALDIGDGFWGLVDRGLEVKLVDNQATLVLDGQPLAGRADSDVTGLRHAENAVASVMRMSSTAEDSAADVTGFDIPTHVTAQTIDETLIRLNELAARWRDLHDGGAIVLTYGRPPVPEVGDAGPVTPSSAVGGAATRWGDRRGRSRRWRR